MYNVYINDDVPFYMKLCKQMIKNDKRDKKSEITRKN